jgi:hypothetical protein
VHDRRERAALALGRLQALEALEHALELVHAAQALPLLRRRCIERDADPLHVAAHQRLAQPRPLEQDAVGEEFMPKPAGARW